MVIFRDEEAEALKAMREQLKARFGGRIGGKPLPQDDDEEEEEGSGEEEEEIDESQGEGADVEMNDEKF